MTRRVIKGYNSIRGQELPYNQCGVCVAALHTTRIRNKPFALGVKLTGNKRTWNIANYKHVQTDIDLLHAWRVDILLVQQRPLQLLNRTLWLQVVYNTGRKRSTEIAFFPIVLINCTVIFTIELHLAFVGGSCNLNHDKDSRF
ncbi:hypothetical protein TNCV_3365591 [Trichonephila clavipes]|nr:hypothetical protein TNCV_3365591 [Trichonephila clavipes]